MSHNEKTAPHGAVFHWSLSKEPSVDPRPSERMPPEERRRTISMEIYGKEERRNVAALQPAEASRGFGIGSYGFGGDCDGATPRIFSTMSATSRILNGFEMNPSAWALSLQ
jgi:hypothetical protein